MTANPMTDAPSAPAGKAGGAAEGVADAVGPASAAAALDDRGTLGERAAVRLGERIRGMRRARALTLVQLAEAAGLSHPFLSQLERGLTRPSMGSLERIARALGTSQVELLAVDSPRLGAGPALSVTRAAGGARGPYSEGRARMLAEHPAAFHPMEFTAENTEFGDAFSHPEDEWLYVLDGVVEVDFGAEGLHVLAPGDAAYYAGPTTHRWRSADGAPYRLLIVKEHPASL